MKVLKLSKKILCMLLIAMQVIVVGPVHKALAVINNDDYTWKVNDFKDEQDLKAKVIQDPEFITNWASVADMLGFAWCGGTKSKYVGGDFSFRKAYEPDKTGATQEVYYLKGNYDSSDPYAGGYRADETLQMKISNVRFVIEPTTLKFGTPRAIETKPLTIASAVLENSSDADDNTSISFSYASNKSWSKSDNFKFNEKIGIKTKVEADIPLIGSESTELTVEFGSEQGWGQSQGTSETQTNTLQYNAKVPAKSRREIDLIGMIKKSEVPYEAKIYIEYDITLTGFLKWKGNARVDHPTDRPTISVTFGGRNGLNAAEDLLDMYNHRDIKGYSDWDWQWVIDKYGKNYTDYYVNGIGKVKRGGVIKGVFDGFVGTEVQVKAHDPQPINSIIRGKHFYDDHKVEIKDFKAYENPGFNVKGVKINK